MIDWIAVITKKSRSIQKMLQIDPTLVAELVMPAALIARVAGSIPGMDEFFPVIHHQAMGYQL